MMEGIRQANIGIATGVVIIVVGTIVFRHSEEALQLVGLIGLCASLLVAVVLLERAERRKENGPQ
jgi:NADH:ubiquinone oxidoreductase subunit 5 (subunit L)/multisubunit Na+/H+ antiporter MnhA subunit